MSAIDNVRSITPIASVANNNAIGAGVYHAARVASVPKSSFQATDTGVAQAKDAAADSMATQTSQTASTVMTEPELKQVVSEANTRLASSNRSMRFRITEDTGDLQIQIVDRERDKVIRSIPSDEMLRLSNWMRELYGVGFMVDTAR